MNDSRLEQAITVGIALAVLGIAATVMVATPFLKNLRR